METPETPLARQTPPNAYAERWVGTVQTKAMPDRG
jgi:hypothetical protein